MIDIKIFDNHKPALEAGQYEFIINQTFTVGGHQLDIPKESLVFEVAAEQYHIDQRQIDSVFPPESGMGDFSLIFPQIILNRSTLPWERLSQKGNLNCPWLALLVFSEDDPVNTVRFSKEKWEGDTTTVVFEDAKPASNTDDTTELISVLVMDSTFFNDNKILPSFSELPYLSHVRKGESEKAIVVANRFPALGKKNTAYLVSFEHCFDSSKDLPKNKTDKNGNMGFVSLKSWSFFCNDHFIISEEMLEAYKNSKATAASDSSQLLVTQELDNALSNIVGQEYFDKKNLTNNLPPNFTNPNLSALEQNRLDYVLETFRIGHLPDILKHLNRTPSSLRLGGKDKYVQQGYLTIPYTLKTGKEISVAYRSPLIPPNENKNDNSIVNIRQADQAFRYLGDINKLDVSYASAWELGKMLALQNKNFSVGLYKWKRECYHVLKRQGTQLTSENYPSPSDFIIKWFQDLKDLKLIPFNYLVSDPELIPFESIRFFKIDEQWIKHLVDGAFSIGRVSKYEGDYDNLIYKFQLGNSAANQSALNFLQTPSGIRSGFLLHSVVVSGWPNLVIYRDGNEDLKPYVKRKLSSNLEICIFDELYNSINIHQKPESIHFGVEDDAEANKLKQGESIIKGLLDQFNQINPGEFKIPAEGGNVSDFANKLVQKIEVVKFG